jgi:hypothetical protein
LLSRIELQPRKANARTLAIPSEPKIERVIGNPLAK